MKYRSGKSESRSGFGLDTIYGLAFAGTFVFGLLSSWGPFIAVAAAPVAYAVVRHAYAWLTDTTPVSTADA